MSNHFVFRRNQCHAKLTDLITRTKSVIQRQGRKKMIKAENNFQFNNIAKCGRILQLNNLSTSFKNSHEKTLILHAKVVFLSTRPVSESCLMIIFCQQILLLLLLKCRSWSLHLGSNWFPMFVVTYHKHTVVDFSDLLGFDLLTLNGRLCQKKRKNIIVSMLVINNKSILNSQCSIQRIGNVNRIRLNTAIGLVVYLHMFQP